MMRGRPAKYSNAAEKQKAYRERVKADEQRAALAMALLDDVTEHEIALRKSVQWLKEKKVNWGTVWIEHYRGILYESASLYVGSRFQRQIDWLLFKHLVRCGSLVKVSAGVHFERYEFAEIGEQHDHSN